MSENRAGQWMFRDDFGADVFEVTRVTPGSCFYRPFRNDTTTERHCALRNVAMFCGTEQSAKLAQEAVRVSKAQMYDDERKARDAHTARVQEIMQHTGAVL